MNDHDEHRGDNFNETRAATHSAVDDDVSWSQDYCAPLKLLTAAPDGGFYMIFFFPNRDTPYKDYVFAYADSLGRCTDMMENPFTN